MQIRSESGASDIYVIHEPRAVNAGRGAGWLIDGFAYFRKAPGQWLVVCVVGFLIMIGLGFIPVIGLFSGILAPVWSAGLLLGCKDLEEGKALRVQHLFAGFGDKLLPLVLSGVLVSCLSIAIVTVILGPVFFAMLTGTESETLANADVPGLLIRILLIFLLMIPVYAASWFSPALIMLGNIGVMDALKFSLSAGLRNLLPFLVYSLMGFVLMIPVILTLGFGMLVVGPMIFASIFISFKEIFIEE
jgi:hypothetical protein